MFQLQILHHLTLTGIHCEDGRIVIVDYWITINEPVSSTIGGGYISGAWPPSFYLDGKRARVALHNLIEAHLQAYDMITNLDDVDADSVGITKTTIHSLSYHNIIGYRFINGVSRCKIFKELLVFEIFYMSYLG